MHIQRSRGDLAYKGSWTHSGPTGPLAAVGHSHRLLTLNVHLSQAFCLLQRHSRHPPSETARSQIKHRTMELERHVNKVGGYQPQGSVSLCPPPCSPGPQSEPERGQPAPRPHPSCPAAAEARSRRVGTGRGGARSVQQTVSQHDLGSDRKGQTAGGQLAPHKETPSERQPHQGFTNKWSSRVF